MGVYQKAIKKHLEVIYPTENTDELTRLITHNFGVGNKYGSAARQNSPWSQKDAVLITYGDTLSEKGMTPIACLEKFRYPISYAVRAVFSWSF